MNSVKITYIVFTTISEMFYLVCAFLTPIHVTPGWYWWSVLCMVLMIVQGIGFNDRLNAWGWWN